MSLILKKYWPRNYKLYYFALQLVLALLETFACRSNLINHPLREKEVNFNGIAGQIRTKQKSLQLLKTKSQSTNVHKVVIHSQSL